MPKTYLIADDSLFARMLVKDAVKQIDSAPVFLEASSGAETIKHNQNNDIDWFLLDVNMGEPNGVDTSVELIKAGVGHKQIALVTGNKSADLQARADELGVRYINKAISPTDVDGFVLRLSEFFDGK